MNNEQKAAREAATTRILEWMETRLCSKISCHQIAEEAVKRAFDAGITARDAEDAWVAVSDRLPTIKGKYLLTWKSVKDDTLFVTQEFCDTVRFGSFGITVENPIAWKRLPQPYQPTEGE